MKEHHLSRVSFKLIVSPSSFYLEPKVNCLKKSYILISPKLSENKGYIRNADLKEQLQVLLLYSIINNNTQCDGFLFTFNIFLKEGKAVTCITFFIY